MRYRIEELAARCDVTVDTVRFYQARGLLPRPDRDGRVAWYGDAHVERLDRIRDLKARGFPLAIIARLLAGELDPQEEALAVALTESLPGDAAEPEERLSLEELGERTGLGTTLLQALEREGLLVGRVDGERPYTAADARTVRSGLALLEAGVPLSELLALARQHDEAMRAVAEHAVDLFVRFVRDPLRATSGSVVEASERAKGKPKAKGSQAGGAPTEFGVPSGVPHEIFAVTGAGGLPQGTLVGPTGVRLPTPAPGEAARTKDGMALSDVDASTVYFTVESPAAGVWVFEPAPGSPAIALAQQADGQKAADVDGKVTGKGQRRTLDYRLTVQPGQKVRFVEEGPDAFQELGSARSGKHELSFSPAPGSPGRRTIRAIVEQDGYPARSLTVATYRASVDESPGPVGSLKASRRGDEVRVRWGGADDADAYHVTVRLSDGRSESYDIPGGRRSLVVERVDRDVSASVTVQGVSFAGKAGPARSTRVKAGREEREARAPRAPRAPDELGSAVVLYAVR